MKTKAHQKYELKDGTIVKGVTTIVNEHLGWNKNVLMAWTRKMCMAGIDPVKKRDQAADIGTIAHYMLECYNKNKTPDLKDYSENDIEKATKCFDAYKDWEGNNKLITKHTELQLVSEEYKYGGTLDWDGMLNGALTIVDYKTGTDIYDEHKIQAAAYQKLYYEKYSLQPNYYILHLGKDGGFAPHKLPDLHLYWKIFVRLLEIDNIRKELKTL